MHFYLYCNIKELQKYLNFFLEKFSKNLKYYFYKIYFFKDHLSISNKFIISNIFLYFYKSVLKDYKNSFFVVKSFVQNAIYF